MLRTAMLSALLALLAAAPAPADGPEKATLKDHKGSVDAVAFSADGALLASGGDDEVIRLWDVKTGKLIRKLKGHDDGILGLAFSPDGKLLASASSDDTVRLWD